MSDLADSAISIAVDSPTWRQLVKVNGKTLRPFTWIYLARWFKAAHNQSLPYYPKYGQQTAIAVVSSPSVCYFDMHAAECARRSE